MRSLSSMGSSFSRIFYPRCLSRCWSDHPSRTGSRRKLSNEGGWSVNLLGQVQVEWRIGIRYHIHDIADDGDLILSPLRLQDFMKCQKEAVNFLAFHAR